jgi:xylulokinase
MEGVVYGMRDSLEIIKELKVSVNEIRVSGGGARSGLWRQIQSDVYNKPITVINVDEGPAFGVALLAGVGTGIYKSVEDACKKTIKVAEKVKPNPDNVKTYEEVYRIYQRLYNSLKDRFDEVAKVVSS